MGLSIHTNFASLTTQSQLNSTNKMLGTAMQRLGTGLRINSAADDAAGLQMATRLQAQSSGQKVGMRNAQDAVSMMQTAEGAMDEMSNIVQRMKDLATQSANGTSTAEDRTAMNAEFTELRAELDNITNNTTFGGQSLLKAGGGFQGNVTFQIGGTAAEKLELKDSGTLATALKEVVGTGKGTLDTDIAAGIGDQGKATAAMAKLDTFSQKIGESRSAFGANINRLEHTVNNLSNMKENGMVTSLLR